MSNFYNYFLLIFVFNFWCVLLTNVNALVLQIGETNRQPLNSRFHNIINNFSRSKRETTTGDFGNQSHRQCFYENVKKCFDGAFTDNVWCMDSLVYSNMAKYYWDQAIYTSYTPNFKDLFINCTTSKIKGMIEPDKPGIFTNLNKLNGEASPRLGSKMKLEHQECIEKYVWKCVINQHRLNCYMNMRHSEVAEIVNSCSNLVYNKLGISIETFEDVKIPT